MKQSTSVLFFFLLASICVHASGPSGPSSPPKSDHTNQQHVIQPKSPDITEKADGDEFRLWYIAKGTRSEGIHGALFVEGKWIIGKEVGETVVSKCGIYVWSGAWDQRKVMWAKSGWLPKELSTVYPSWNIKTKSPNRVAGSINSPRPHTTGHTGP
jgi:hypothetical protein